MQASRANAQPPRQARQRLQQDHRAHQRALQSCICPGAGAGALLQRTRAAHPLHVPVTSYHPSWSHHSCTMPTSKLCLPLTTLLPPSPSCRAPGKAGLASSSKKDSSNDTSSQGGGRAAGRAGACGTSAWSKS